MSNSYSITGKIYKISETEQVSERFKTRKFILFVENPKTPQYSDHITFEFSQAYCDLLDQFQVGQMVDVKFDLGGRLYTDKKNGEEKTFDKLKAWKIEHAGGVKSQTQTQQAPPPQAAAQQEYPKLEPNDDLPF